MSFFYFKLNLPVCILHSGRYALKFKFDAAKPPPPTPPIKKMFPTPQILVNRT